MKLGLAPSKSGKNCVGSLVDLQGKSQSIVICEWYESIHKLTKKEFYKRTPTPDKYPHQNGWIQN